MSVTTPPRAPMHARAADKPATAKRRRWWVGLAVLVLGAAGLVSGLLVATGGGGPGSTTTTSVPSTTTPPQTTVPTTTTSPPATTTTLPPPTTTSPPATTTVPPPPANETSAVFPSPGSGIRFADPVAAARAFAVDFVGFVGPVVGPFAANGGESGTVAVRANATGVITTVSLRRFSGSWWVLGSSTTNIRLDSPSTSALIASPVRLQGVSTAFEATVNVEVRQDGQRAPIGSGYVMGGSMGIMGTFDGVVAFSTPASTHGALVLSTVSMESGHTFEATVLRVAFAPSLVPVPTTACPDYAIDRPAPPSGEMVVTVFYSCGVGAVPVPTYRVYPTTTAVLRTALDQLLAGPTAAERSAGLTSWFSSATATYLVRVTLASGVATVDFTDLRPVIPNASTSAGAHMLLAQLDATVFQYPTVHSVLYRINGSCEAFGDWLQLSACVPRTRSTTGG